jgi:hypothetical protein
MEGQQVPYPKHVMSMYHTRFKKDNLRVYLMEAVPWHFELIASCTHNSPVQVRFPFHTPKRCQGTFHDVGLQYIVELRWSPSSARLCPPICFVWKSQLLLQVLSYPLCQFSGQPPQNWMCCSVCLLQPLYEPSPTLCLYVAPAENMVGRVPHIPLFLAGNTTPTIPHVYSKRKESGFPMGCADAAALDGRHGSNVYEVNPWLWQFGRGKPRLGGLTVGETVDRQLAKDVDRKKRAAETRRRRKADQA